jgi:hypothetical protein
VESGDTASRMTARGAVRTRVLVVEDEQDIASLVKHGLERGRPGSVSRSADDADFGIERKGSGLEEYFSHWDVNAWVEARYL